MDNAIINRLQRGKETGNCVIFCEDKQLKNIVRANIMTSMRCRDTIDTASVVLRLR